VTQRSGLLDEPVSVLPSGRSLTLSVLISEARRRGLEATVERAEESRCVWLASVLPLAAVRRLRDIFDDELRRWPDLDKSEAPEPEP
jgi:hypothetical protein